MIISAKTTENGVFIFNNDGVEVLFLFYEISNFCSNSMW